ncbi:MAG: DUF2142 domain-containing protein [Solirubrobacteraceae bacterium]
MAVIGANERTVHRALTFIAGDQHACQPGGTLPQGTQAIRLSLSANVGPKISVRVLSHSTTVTEGSHAAGWGVDETVTVPVTRVPRTIPNAIVCTDIGLAAEAVQVNGERAAGVGRGVLLHMEYLAPSSTPWLSLVPGIAHNMGTAHAPSGTWVFYLAILAVVSMGVLASRTLLMAAAMQRPSSMVSSALGVSGVVRHTHAGLRHVPRVAWSCALLASASAICWSVITPPFQVPDEPSHFAYVQLLAETGTLPKSDSYRFSPAEDASLLDLHEPQVRWHPAVHTVTSRSALVQLRDDLSQRSGRSGTGAAGVAASEPPLYYALETIPYNLGSSGTLLDQLELMRAMSAALAGLTAFFVVLFLRELIPGDPWAYTVGGLAAALAPLLGFTSGAVTPDAMLCAVSAAVFFCVARAFNRGLSGRLAIAIGILTAMGLLTKLNFIGLLPGALTALLLLALRGRGAGLDAFCVRRFVAIALVIAVSPICVYALVNLLSGSPTFGIVSSSIGSLTHQPGNMPLLSASSYIWQFYLPRLPTMTNYFPGLLTVRDLWFDRIVGLYGWLDTSFPVWVENLALIPATLLAILALHTLYERRSALARRVPELCAYAVMAAGLLVVTGGGAYLSKRTNGVSFAQPRYLLPLLPLGAAGVALAVKGVGKRSARAIGVLIVTLFFAHEVFSQLLVIARYYGASRS